MDMFNDLIDKLSGWVDKGFEWFGFYSTNYSKYLVYALLIAAASKIFKIKLDLKTGK